MKNQKQPSHMDDFTCVFCKHTFIFTVFSIGVSEDRKSLTVLCPNCKRDLVEKVVVQDAIDSRRDNVAVYEVFVGQHKTYRTSVHARSKEEAEELALKSFGQSAMSLFQSGTPTASASKVN